MQRMPFFKKDKKTLKKSSAETKIKNRDKNSMVLKEKTKIGFRHKEKKPSKKEKNIEKEYIQPEKEDVTYEKTEKDQEQDYKKTDILTDIYSEEEIAVHKEEKEWPKDKKRKTFIKKDMKGKPVYLEDTGEKLGTVFDMIYDKENNLRGYKIKDSKSDAVLSFPFDQFDEDKNGLIFIPSWYTQTVKTIEKLEFKDRISPELTSLLTDDAISNEELYEIFVKHDDEMVTYIDDAITLNEMLNRRLKILEKQRLSLKDSLMDLTEKRLIKDIDRRKFSEDVMEHRRKVNILDVNINKCKELIERLDRTSFGTLGKKTILSDIDIEDSLYEKTHENLKEKNKIVFDDELVNPYKQKYYTLKEQFEQLEEDYNELKISVEKLLDKNEI